jgi:phosphopantothenoylcysteine decarboxylase/phosphopantothenate--cysteine ligase
MRALPFDVHPAERLRGASSRLLDGKTIVLAVTGSIAAVRTVELARELIRHGARVVPVMSRDAQKIIHPYALEFATGMRPITEITGQVEHVSLMGRGEGKADLLLIAPATGNTISKMALGIDDSPVTTFFATAAAANPVMLAPAMHDTMYDNPILVANLERLRAIGVEVLDSLIEESKAKMMEPDAIVEHVLRRLGPRTLAGKRILVVNGATQEAVDEMRVLSNRSSGRMGAALAREAFRAGAEVEHWYAHGDLGVAAPDGAQGLPRVPTRRFSSVDDLLALLPETKRFDAIVVPAALSDFAPAKTRGKLPSEADAPTLALRSLPKFIREIRKHSDAALVSFKAESGVTDTQLVEKARRSMDLSGARFVVANLLDNAGADKARVILVDAKSATPLAGTKDEVARGILGRLVKDL